MRLVLSDRALTCVPVGRDFEYVDLSALKIAPCVGCFGCWTRTPGKCVIRDDAVRVYPLIAASDEVVYVSRIRYGGYDSVMKRMLERAIPVQQAFIRIHGGETHHVQRVVEPKRAVIVAYGAEDEAERDLFRRFVARNARNMSFESYDIRFVGEAILDTPFRLLAGRRIAAFARAVAEGRAQSMHVTMPITKRMFVWASDIYWRMYGRRHGVSKRQMESMRIE